MGCGCSFGVGCITNINELPVDTVVSNMHPILELEDNKERRQNYFGKGKLLRLSFSCSVELLCQNRTFISPQCLDSYNFSSKEWLASWSGVFVNVPEGQSNVDRQGIIFMRYTCE